MKQNFNTILFLAVSAALASDALCDSSPTVEKNYSYLYFENGYPTLSWGRRPQSNANLVARDNPDLVFQTGYYSLMLDCDDVALKGFDALAGTDYLSALNQDVTQFTPASSFSLQLTQSGVDYFCTEGLVNGKVRLIESGQYVKRIDHVGLVFKNSANETLEADNQGKPLRLEITAWPDRVTFRLDASGVENDPITNAKIELISPGGVTHTAESSSNQARLTLKPHEDLRLSSLSTNDYIAQATNLQNNTPLTVDFDTDTHAFEIIVPVGGVTYPSGRNRVDEFLIEVSNPHEHVANVPLRFIKSFSPAITGTSMLLSDANSGRPLGIPVQISKNWHVDWDNRTTHDGQWLRGSTLLNLQAGETRRMKLRVAYGYWGGAGTVSHAQLSLIGYGGNWKWDESALGAWGESLTFDPTQHIGSAFLDDIRPTFTQSYKNNGQYKDGGTANTTHNWTENVGGGDFLVYFDSANTYRWLKRIKTCYYQTGPNLTEVHYSGVTDDDRIRTNYTSRMVSTLDYHRRFHAYKYEFLEDVTTPRRLVFYQMGADWYTTSSYNNFHIGDANGLLGTVDINDGTDPINGGNKYKGDPVAMDGKWLSIEDETGNSGGTPAYALRGLIPLSSTLNGDNFPLHVHNYGRSWGGNNALFDFSSDSVKRSYQAGDVVTGEIEFIMPPKHSDSYWGGDTELINRLAVYNVGEDDATWQTVRDELVANIGMNVSVHLGTLLNNYPLEIQPVSGNRVLTDLTIESGGIGHVPIILKGADAGLGLKVQRYSSGTWVDIESVDIENDTYYQAVQNANGTMDYTFSIPRPSGEHNLDAPWRIRILYAQFTRLDTPPQEAHNFSGADGTETDGYLQLGDTGFVKGWNSGWTVTGGILSNNSSNNNNTGEGALGRMIPVDELSANEGNLLTLSFDYHLNDPAEVLYLHLWVLIGQETNSTNIMNLGAQNGNAWYTGSNNISMFHLTDGVSTDDNARAAAVSLTGTRGWRTYNRTFDISEFSDERNNLSKYDYIVLGLAREVGNATTSGVSVSNIALSVNSKGEEEVPYEKWASDHGLTLAGAEDDADGDGASNLREFVFGGNPTLASSVGPLPFMRKVEDSETVFLDYVFRRRIGAGSVLRYELQTSLDMSPNSWTTSGYVELPPTATGDPDFEEIIGRIDTSEAPQKFMRVVVETP